MDLMPVYVLNGTSCGFRAVVFDYGSGETAAEVVLLD